MAIASTETLPVPRGRGAPKGNLNAVKHGRHSTRVRETRALVRAAHLPDLALSGISDGIPS
jgi:hypothetical protein